MCFRIQLVKVAIKHGTICCSCCSVLRKLQGGGQTSMLCPVRMENSPVYFQFPGESGVLQLSSQVATEARPPVIYLFIPVTTLTNNNWENRAHTLRAGVACERSCTSATTKFSNNPSERLNSVELMAMEVKVQRLSLMVTIGFVRACIPQTPHIGPTMSSRRRENCYLVWVVIVQTGVSR